MIARLKLALATALIRAAGHLLPRMPARPAAVERPRPEQIPRFAFHAHTQPDRSLRVTVVDRSTLRTCTTWFSPRTLSLGATPGWYPATERAALEAALAEHTEVDARA